MKICASRGKDVRNIKVQLINSFKKYLLNTYYVPDTILKLTTVYRMDKVLALLELIF